MAKYRFHATAACCLTYYKKYSNESFKLFYYHAQFQDHRLSGASVVRPPCSSYWLQKFRKYEIRVVSDGTMSTEISENRSHISKIEMRENAYTQTDTQRDRHARHGDLISQRFSLRYALQKGSRLHTCSGAWWRILTDRPAPLILSALIISWLVASRQAKMEGWGEQALLSYQLLSPPHVQILRSAEL